MSAPPGFRTVVLVPCYNEEVTVAKVVADFNAALPGCTVYVYDNNSKDRTMEVARAAGAVVRRERLQGKGHVVRRMFGDVDADIYVMIDGDGTYHAPSAPEMIRTLVEEDLDMVVGARVSDAEAAYRPGHRFGNAALTGFVAFLFGDRFTDMLSGYRVFSRRYVKSFPALSAGFEIETELTVHALELGLPVAEVSTPYGVRPQGSVSKLSTYRDGFRIARTILRLFKEEKPREFFLIIAALFAVVSVVLAVPVLQTFLETGLVPRLPTALLSTGLMILAVLCLFSGFILESVAYGRREVKRLSYLAVPPMRRALDRRAAGSTFNTLVS